MIALCKDSHRLHWTIISRGKLFCIAVWYYI